MVVIKLSQQSGVLSRMVVHGDVRHSVSGLTHRRAIEEEPTANIFY